MWESSFWHFPFKLSSIFFIFFFFYFFYNINHKDSSADKIYFLWPKIRWVKPLAFNSTHSLKNWSKNVYFVRLINLKILRWCSVPGEFQFPLQSVAWRSYAVALSLVSFCCSILQTDALTYIRGGHHNKMTYIYSFLWPVIKCV